MRIENVDIDIFLAPQPIDSSASCISRGSAHDRELVSCLTLFKVGVFAFEAVLKTLPRNCNATSLNAKVGPCQSSSTYSLSSTCFSGVVCSCLKVAYDRLMISARSSDGTELGETKREMMRKESSAKERFFHDSFQSDGRIGIPSGM